LQENTGSQAKKANSEIQKKLKRKINELDAHDEKKDGESG